MAAVHNSGSLLYGRCYFRLADEGLWLAGSLLECSFGLLARQGDTVLLCGLGERGSCLLYVQL